MTATTPATTTAVTTTTTTSTTTSTPSGTPVPVGALLFGDEFNGAAGALPSSTKWGAKTFTSGASGCVWDGWNLVHEDGNGDVILGAQKKSTGGWQCSFISGKTSYSGPRYEEARAKVACGVGTWSAPLWSWASPFGAGGLENDTNEQLGRQPGSYHTTVHNWTVSPQKQSGVNVATSSTLCNGFHVYGAAVYSSHIDYYLDGTKVSTITAAAVGLSNLAGFAEVANVDLNMGGSWAGTPTISGPVSMVVDYVRVYALS